MTADISNWLIESVSTANKYIYFVSGFSSSPTNENVAKCRHRRRRRYGMNKRTRPHWQPHRRCWIWCGLLSNTIAAMCFRSLVRRVLIHIAFGCVAYIKPKSWRFLLFIYFLHPLCATHLSCTSICQRYWIDERVSHVRTRSSISSLCVDPTWFKMLLTRFSECRRISASAFASQIPPNAYPSDASQTQPQCVCLYSKKGFSIHTGNTQRVKSERSEKTKIVNWTRNVRSLWIIKVGIRFAVNAKNHVVSRIYCFDSIEANWKWGAFAPCAACPCTLCDFWANSILVDLFHPFLFRFVPVLAMKKPSNERNHFQLNVSLCFLFSFFLSFADFLCGDTHTHTGTFYRIF